MRSCRWTLEADYGEGGTEQREWPNAAFLVSEFRRSTGAIRLAEEAQFYECC